MQFEKKKVTKLTSFCFFYFFRNNSSTPPPDRDQNPNDTVQDGGINVSHRPQDNSGDQNPCTKVQDDQKKGKSFENSTFINVHVCRNPIKFISFPLSDKVLKSGRPDLSYRKS